MRKLCHTKCCLSLVWGGLVSVYHRRNGGCLSSLLRKFTGNYKGYRMNLLEKVCFRIHNVSVSSLLHVFSLTELLPRGARQSTLIRTSRTWAQCTLSHLMAPRIRSMAGTFFFRFWGSFLDMEHWNALRCSKYFVLPYSRVWVATQWFWFSISVSSLVRDIPPGHKDLWLTFLYSIISQLWSRSVGLKCWSYPHTPRETGIASYRVERCHHAFKKLASSQIFPG